MHIVKRDELVILDNRQRQEFDPVAMQELINSIADRGLLHAPVMRLYNDNIVLVAGERRLKALEEMWELGMEVRYDGRVIPPGCVPYVTLGEIDPLEAEEAELDENLKRRDLTWQEHAAAVERLHALRTAQAVEVRRKINAENTEAMLQGKPIALLPSVQTVAATAKELTGRSDGAFQDSVRRELIVAKHLDDPEVAKAKSVDEAFKLLKRKEERKQNMELAAAIGESFSASSHQLYNLDCLHFMRQPEQVERFDVILTDPPYGMGADEFGDAAGKMSGIEHHYDDSFASWERLMLEWAKLSFQVAKPQAHAYVFCDIDNFPLLRTWMREAGWYVFRTPFTLVKLNSGRVPLPDRGPRRQTEWILYAIKGNKPVTHIYPDVISCTGDDNLGHGAQKPIAAYQNLLQRSVKPGDVVFDPFAGSGTIFPAAHLYKVTAVGCEVDPGSYGIALKRMQELDSQGELPV